MMFFDRNKPFASSIDDADSQFANSITIGIPTFNGEKFLEEAVKSVYYQTVKVNNIIIVDDCSTDQTIKKIDELEKKYPSLTIKLFINKVNEGYQKNWNKCFKYCQTKYLLILHQDDILKDNAIEKLGNFFNRNNEFALIGGREEIIDNKKKVIRKYNNRKDLVFTKGEIYEFISTNGTYIPCSTVMFDMDKIIEVGYFETNILATDELFWPKILHKYPIAILGESIIFRRKHPAQAEWSDFNNKPKEIVSAHKHFLKLENYENRIEYKKKIRKLINNRFSKNLLGISASVIRYYGNDKLAVWYLKQALKLDTVLPLKTNLFWKVLLIIILDKLGLFNLLRRYKQYIQTFYR